MDSLGPVKRIEGIMDCAMYRDILEECVLLFANNIMVGNFNKIMIANIPHI